MKDEFTLEEKGSSSLIIGEVFDTIYYPDGRVEKREKSFNLIMKSFSTLIGAFIKGDTDYTGGNLYWAIGSGQTTWDTSTFTPVDSATQLTNEVFRKEIPLSSRYFVNQNGDRVTTVTNRIQLDIVIEGRELNGFSLREFGIFGGNASSVANSGIMINHKVHARIDKTEGMRIVRSIRLTFN